MCLGLSIYVYIVYLATGKDTEKERLLSNEKQNFKLLAQKVHIHAPLNEDYMYIYI